MLRQPRLLIVLVVGLAFTGWPTLAQTPPSSASPADYREPDWENTKSPSPTGCDAWFGNGGRSEAGRYDATFTLTNLSTSPECLARKVTIWMQSSVARDALNLTTPPGWTLTILPCPNATTVCGWTWHHPDGVPPSAVVRGFGLVYFAPARLRVWQIDVGSRRVGMPYGYVGG